ncbi:MAG: serine hydrolase [Bacteroidota bacterium]
MKCAVYIPSIYRVIVSLTIILLYACQPEQPVKQVEQLFTPQFTSRPSVDPFKGVDEQEIDAVLAGMSLEEKIGQLIIWTPDFAKKETANKAAALVKEGKVGGFLPTQMDVEDFLFWKDSLERTAAIPLMTGTREKVMLHGQFRDMADFPNRQSIAAIDSAALTDYLEKEYLRQCNALKINFSFRSAVPLAADHSDLEYSENYLLEKRLKHDHDVLKKNRLLGFANNFSMQHVEPNDSIRIARLQRVYDFTSSGLPGLHLTENIFESEKIKSAPSGFLKNYLGNKLGFKGLALVELLEGESPELKLLQGADLFLTAEVGYFYEIVQQLFAEGQLTEYSIDQKVRKILKAKSWIHGGRLPVELSIRPKNNDGLLVKKVSWVNKQSPKLVRNYRHRQDDFKEYVNNLTTYFEDPAWGHFAKSLYKNSLTCASDLNKLLPFNDFLEKDFQLIEFGKSDLEDFKFYFSKYTDYSALNFPMRENGHLPTIKLNKSKKQKVVLVLLDQFRMSPNLDKSFINQLNLISQNINVVVVNFGYPENLRLFEDSITFLQVFEKNKITEIQAAQSLFGGVAVNGQMPVEVSQKIPLGASVKIKKERLSFDGSDNAEIAPERLVGIDAIALNAIKNRVFPGCQIAVVKDGHVVYSKAFGHHTYSKKKPVKTTHLYDIASVSKIAATTLAVMKLDEKNQISINGKIEDYAQLSASATVGHIKLKNLLIHSTRLQSPMPIAKFYNYRSVPSSGCNDIFCNSKKDSFEIQVAPSLFFRKDFQDTIWNRVVHLKSLKKKSFRYSDVNFYLLQKIVEDISRQPLDEFVDNHFYHSLGLRKLTYNPYLKFDKQEIVPTERDRVWRKDLIHGFVHDPSAALMGGVGGNAGLFSNAEDLAVLFEVLANDGEYGGIQYFDQHTINKFTTAKYGNHRGLGFDKPTPRKYQTYSRKTPASTFGHNGFTGTCVWIDPENDLVYVFLSNRIHPSTSNKKIFVEGVRKRIHDVVYNSFNSLDTTLPTLGN